MLPSRSPKYHDDRDRNDRDRRPSHGHGHHSHSGGSTSSTSFDRIQIKDCLLLPLGFFLATLLVFIMEYTSGRGLIQPPCRYNVTTSPALQELMRQRQLEHQHEHGMSTVDGIDNSNNIIVTRVVERSPHPWDAVDLADDGSGHDIITQHLYDNSNGNGNGNGANGNGVAGDHTAGADGNSWIWYDEHSPSIIPEWWGRSEVTIIPQSDRVVPKPVLSCVPCNGLVFVTSVNDRQSLAAAEKWVTSVQQYASQCPILIHYNGMGDDIDHSDMITAMLGWRNVVVLQPSLLVQHRYQLSSASMPPLSRLRPWIIRDSFEYLKRYRTFTADANGDYTPNKNGADITWPWPLPHGCSELDSNGWYDNLRVLYMDSNWRLLRSDLTTLINMMGDDTDNHDIGPHSTFYVPINPRNPALANITTRSVLRDYVKSFTSASCSLAVQGYHHTSFLLKTLFHSLPDIDSINGLLSLTEQSTSYLRHCTTFSLLRSFVFMTWYVCANNNRVAS
jgi:hypothetical protein